MSSLMYNLNNQNNISSDKKNSQDKNNENFIINKFSYNYSEVIAADDAISNTNTLKPVNISSKFTIIPKTINYEFKTNTKIPKLGLLLVGLGGNNGTTLLGSILANKLKLKWHNKSGEQLPNFYGSITQSSTTKIGIDKNNKEIYLPLKDILPMVDPVDILIHGWDISSLNLSDAMKRAQVFDYDLQCKLEPFLEKIKPLPGVYYPEFIAANQNDRANHTLTGKDKFAHLETLRRNIREFKAQNKLDKVVILWTANTEKMSKEIPNLNDTSENLLLAIKKSSDEVSPSTIYAVASILEGCSFINGSPQNTLLPGVIQLAAEHNVFLAGNDFKSGQTKFKTMFTDFLVQAGIKPKAIVSYNHLGNNDGKNLSSEEQFKSKEKSKSSCVDDILYSNGTLYKPNERIDHCIVIKYIPSTGDTKKAMDEYTSEIFMGGQHVLSCYNVCEDSLLAAPIILDLVILTELFERIEVRKLDGGNNQNWQKFDTILDCLGYLLKAPLTRENLPVVNSLARQKSCIENLLKVCAGIPIESNLLLERRLSEPVVVKEKMMEMDTKFFGGMSM